MSKHPIPHTFGCVCYGEQDDTTCDAEVAGYEEDDTPTTTVPASDHPTQTWTLEDADDCSPGDYILGHLRGEWVADEESLAQAIVAMVSATLVNAGVDIDLAVDKAIELVEQGVGVIYDRSTGSLSFEVIGDDDE